MPVHKIDFTPWQLRTIRALALAEGAKVEKSIDDANAKENPTEMDRMHLRLLGDYLEMLRDMVDQIETYATEVGGL